MKTLYFSITLFHICFINYILILLDIYNSLEFYVTTLIIFLLLTYLTASNGISCFLTGIINLSENKNISSTFIQSLSYIEKIGNYIFVIAGIFFIFKEEYLIFPAILFALTYILYLVYWVIYFNKYHIKFYS